MCLALASYSFDGYISGSQMEESIQRVTSLIYANKRTTEGRGPDPLAAATKEVIEYLLSAPNQEMRKQQILWRGYGVVNTFTLDQIIENLLEMGWITRIKTNNNKDWIIRLAGEPLEGYKRYVGGKG